MLHLDVEALNAHLKLQYARRELGDHVLEPIRQVIGNDFEMHKQVWCDISVRQAIQKKLQNPQRRINLQIECAIHKLEVTGSAPVQRVQFHQKHVQIKRPCGFIQRTQTKLALERTAARGLDVQQAMCQISVGVFGIGQRDLVQRGLFTGDNFHQRLRAV